jgi:hypothetical protein
LSLQKQSIGRLIKRRIVSTLEAAYSIDVAPLEQRIQDLEAERDRLKQENEQLNDVKIPCVHVAQDVAHSRCIKCNYDSAKAGMQYAHARLSTAEKLLASI